jgi:hypothetical protein
LTEFVTDRTRKLMEGPEKTKNETTL